MNNKDNNADLGNQTIEGTSPPIALDAEIVVPKNGGSPTAEELDRQLEALLSDPIEPDVIMSPPPADDLDKQLDALIAETEELESKKDDIDSINAQLDALLNDNWEEVPDESAAKNAEAEAETVIVPEAPSDEAVIVPPDEPIIAMGGAENEAPVILGESENAENAENEAPVILGDATEPESTDSASTEPAEPVYNEQPEHATHDHAASSDAEAAREMLEQTKQLMEQIREQAMAAQAAPAHAADEASREMMRQAQMMLEQARLEQQRLQQQQAAQQYAQQAASNARPAPGYGAQSEVARLKSELDGMRELVNRLTMTISQLQSGVPAQQIPLMYAQQQQPRHDADDRDQYRRLESELERMRREIMEKDLRDREKELDRRQKEAESTVKDIRPEMVQMSDARDNVPVPMSSQSASVGGEFIPLANGVYYSIKDKQVYVMTPASNAAAASPTIEPKRSAPPPRRAVAKRRPVARRRPGAPMHRRPGGGPRRPMRPGHR